jgi:hypothetical protein
MVAVLMTSGGSVNVYKHMYLYNRNCYSGRYTCPNLDDTLSHPYSAYVRGIIRNARNGKQMTRSGKQLRSQS